MWYVYILLSEKDGNKYIGSTNDLNRRFERHNNGYVPSTKNRRPFALIGYQRFESVREAALYEKKYKRSHGALERSIKRGEVIIIKRLSLDVVQ